MSETTILGEQIETKSGTIESQTITEASKVDPTGENPLAELVGEGKKYATIEELAKAKIHADTFIETLKQEKSAVEQEREALRLEAAKAKTVDDVLAALHNQSSSTNFEDNSSDDPSEKPMSPEALEQAIADALDKKDQAAIVAEQKRRIAENQKKAWEMLADKDVFGSLDAAKDAVAKYVNGDDQRANVINTAGSFDPTSLVRMLKPDAKIPTSLTGESRLNIEENTQQHDGQLSGWSEVQRVKKENPRLWKSGKFQAKVLAAMKADPNFRKK